MFGSCCCLVFIVFSAITSALKIEDPSLHRYSGYISKTKGTFSSAITLADVYYKFPDNINDAVATGFWDENYNVTGWSVLEIRTSENFTNIDQVYAAGLLEGTLTRELIALQWQNAMAGFCDKQMDACLKLKGFYESQLNWIYAQIDGNPNDEYWHQTNLLLIQLNGLIDGYENETRGPRKEISDTLGLFQLQGIASYNDILIHLGFPNISHQDHCSALIKLLPDNEDIFVSHATWSDYNLMLKVIKRYTMPLKRTSTSSTTIPGSDILFSSYPGMIQSLDDFYMTRPSNLTILETTLDNYNHDLYDNIQPKSVPEWMRIIVANRLANSGQEWVNEFFMYNDGTYNNEWMIADFKQFTPKQSPKSGFLTIAEQMTTYHQSEDMTAILNSNRYWASYNNIYFPNFRNISGEEEMAKTNGPELYSWQNSSRARIFRRDHHQVVDLSTMIHMMRYNDFQHDDLSKCNCTPTYSATLTIAARADLNDINGTYPDRELGFACGGATDAKISSYELMEEFTVVAIAGPTRDQQKSFVWSQSYCDTKTRHFGQPDQWNFEPFTPKWELP